MSELAASDNADLYRELGLEEYLEPRVFDEDPGLTNGRTSPPWTGKEFVDYFVAMDKDGSPLEGYSVLANRLINQLDNLTAIRSPFEEEDSPLPLNRIEVGLVQRDRNEGKYVDKSLLASEESPASRAFRSQIEYLLRPRMVLAEQSGSRQRTFSKGRYVNSDGQTINIYLTDESKDDPYIGPHSTLTITTEAPIGMFKRRPVEVDSDESHFYTTGETQEEVLNLYQNTLGEIPTAPIDEEQIVLRVFRKAA